MRSFRLGFFLAAAAVTLALAHPAAADRPTCEDLLSARELGRSAEQVAGDFRTTRARVDACARVAEQRARLAARQARVEAERAQRSAR